jgi:hypothetical protein
VNEDRTCANSDTPLTQAGSRPVRGAVPAADQLAEIRARIAELREREAELRDGFINGSLSTEGIEHDVVIETKLNERLNLALMREQMPPHVWAPYVIKAESRYVTVKPRAAKQDPGTVAKATASQRVAKAR